MVDRPVRLIGTQEVPGHDLTAAGPPNPRLEPSPQPSGPSADGLTDRMQCGSHPKMR